jgi:hypothetical protein
MIYDLMIYNLLIYDLMIYNLQYIMYFAIRRLLIGNYKNYRNYRNYKNKIKPSKN